MKQTTTQAQQASVEACVGTLGALGGAGIGVGVAMPVVANALSHGDVETTILFGAAGLVAATVGGALLRSEWKKSTCDTVIGATVGLAIIGAGYAYLFAPHIR